MSNYIIPMNKVTPWDWNVAQLAKLAMMYDKPGERDDILTRAKAAADLYRIEMTYYATLMPIMIWVFVWAETPGEPGLLAQAVTLCMVGWIAYVTVRIVKACRRVAEARYIYATIDQGGYILEHGCLRGSRPLPSRSAWDLFWGYWKMGL